jgi:hypothetical protein
LSGLVRAEIRSVEMEIRWIFEMTRENRQVSILLAFRFVRVVFAIDADGSESETE